MECPEENILFELINGELEENNEQPLIDHIGQCKDCQRKIKLLIDFDAMLDKIENNASHECPDASLLNMYESKELDGKQRDKIAKHIDECLSCQLVLKERRRILKELESFEVLPSHVYRTLHKKYYKLISKKAKEQDNSA
jgi:hypothetical protein